MDGQLYGWEFEHIFELCLKKKSEQFLGSFGKNNVQQSSIDQYKYMSARPMNC